MSRLLIEYLKPKDLKKYSKNSRTHSEEQVLQIMDSINQFGFVNPILVDELSEIIAGHGRLEAAKKAKLETIPVIRLTGLDENQKKALRISDNQLPLNAGWNLDILAEEISLLKDDGFDLDILGFDDDFLDDLILSLDSGTSKNDCKQIETEKGETDPEKEWEGMPEYNQEDKTAYRTIHVHFSCQSNVDKFEELIQQKITDKTKFIWFPFIEIETYADKRYIGEE